MTLYMSLARTLECIRLRIGVLLSRLDDDKVAAIVLSAHGGLAADLAAWLARNHRAWFGAAMMGILFVPLLFLPGRLFSAYCYLPFARLAIASVIYRQFEKLDLSYPKVTSEQKAELEKARVKLMEERDRK